MSFRSVASARQFIIPREARNLNNLERYKISPVGRYDNVLLIYHIRNYIDFQ